MFNSASNFLGTTLTMHVHLINGDDLGVIFLLAAAGRFCCSWFLFSTHLSVTCLAKPLKTSERAFLVYGIELFLKD